MPEKLLRASDIATSLDISVSFAYQLMRLGVIPSVRVGRSLRVRPQILQAFIDTHLNGEVGMHFQGDLKESDDGATND